MAEQKKDEAVNDAGIKKEVRFIGTFLINDLGVILTLNGTLKAVVSGNEGWNGTYDLKYLNGSTFQLLGYGGNAKGSKDKGSIFTQTGS
eukprot:CAMPEP_0201590704 /NCGR_PEP_ID=MMETSP0190_2-20130828/181022_1 /ASSEMBLY_ACC=CAM_ASM_000263 /TAXON_ID=37353 /ORGANISM="Rosalina sp." /LENGTH=88 /DNA_ID=CAMNT_0048047429 /DNA_START=70 /DNA_END=333 /DNA_ORIENTATION=-